LDRLGTLRAGLAAWCGFTLPSALAMILFAYGVNRFGDLDHAVWLHGLKIVATALLLALTVGFTHGQRSRHRRIPDLSWTAII
jgi:chromate transport protein ChrA